MAWATFSWTLAGGGLPPGFALDSAGVIAGVATTDGTYSFGVRATDSASPAQTTTAQEAIQVVEPISITSAATWPDACVNQPYSFAVHTTGGTPPLFWGFFSNNWVGISMDQSTGIFSGFSTVTGAFQGSVNVFDATTHGVSQNVTLTVKQCP